MINPFIKVLATVCIGATGFFTVKLISNPVTYDLHPVMLTQVGLPPTPPANPISLNGSNTGTATGGENSNGPSGTKQGISIYNNTFNNVVLPSDSNIKIGSSSTATKQSKKDSNPTNKENQEAKQKAEQAAEANRIAKELGANPDGL